MPSNSTFAALGLCSLLFTACAGTPNGPQVASSKPAKCERSTGSLLCGNADDQNVVGPSALTNSSPRSNATQSALTGSR